MTPKRALQPPALAEAITWALLLVAMWLKYGPAQSGLAVAIAGSLHGTAFISYLFALLVVGANQRFSWLELALGAAASIVPFATIPFELVLGRSGRLDGDWRRAGVDFGRTRAAGTEAEAVAPSRAPLERLLPLVGWCRMHPLTLAASCLLLCSIILAGALRGAGAA